MWRVTKLARALLCSTVLLVAGCTRVVDGTALSTFGDHRGVHGVDVDAILLDQSRMQAITGAGEHLTIIPTMDGTAPVDIDAFADAVPQQCRFIFAETATFGPNLAEFHKTTFQDPPDSALISEGAAAYPDAAAARRAFGDLVATVGGCADTSPGRVLVGDWNANADSLHTRPGECGRDYRLLSVALLEVTFCGFRPSVSDIVMTNIAGNVPS